MKASLSHKTVGSQCSDAPSQDPSSAKNEAIRMNCKRQRRSVARPPAAVRALSASQSACPKPKDEKVPNRNENGRERTENSAGEASLSRPCQSSIFRMHTPVPRQASCQASSLRRHPHHAFGTCVTMKVPSPRADESTMVISHANPSAEEDREASRRRDPEAPSPPNVEWRGQGMRMSAY